MTKEERKEIRRKKNMEIADLEKKHTMKHVGTMKYEEGKVTVGGEFWDTIDVNVKSGLLGDP